MKMTEKKKKRIINILDGVLFFLWIVCVLWVFISGDISRYDFGIVALTAINLFYISVTDEKIINAQKKIIDIQQERINILETYRIVQEAIRAEEKKGKRK